MRVGNVVSAVDVHACGEPGRVITGGVLDVPGNSMFEKMRYLRLHHDDLRKRMLREPRGYPAMCCNLILPPTTREADAGYVIMEQTEYPPMSGSNTICVVTVLIETGMVRAEEPTTRLCLETPAGLIRVDADVCDGKVTGVTFENVPAYAAYLDAPLEVPGVGTVTVDVGWGGMYYVIADVGQLGLQVVPEQAGDIARMGEKLRAAAAEQLPVTHPENPDVSGVSISQLTEGHGEQGMWRNAVVVSSGEMDWDNPDACMGVLDRSPCGTGTCARMAVLHAKGLLDIGETFPHEGILGTVFTGRLLRETMLGEQRAVVPALTGQGWITGMAQYVLDPTDPFPEGFKVTDLWGPGD